MSRATLKVPSTTATTRPDVRSRAPAPASPAGVPRFLRGRSFHSPSRDPVSPATAEAGSPLPYRPALEGAFGADLGDVRTALGTPAAARATEATQSNAVTVGNRIVFAQPSPSPELVSHEVAHVLQARNAGGGDHQDSEREAREVAPRAARGESVAIAQASSPGEPHFDRRSNAASTDPGAVTGTFTEGEPERPDIQHDHGFLDDGSGNLDTSLMEAPTWRDRLSLMKWRTKLLGAETLRPDLVDGTAAYRHFLFGGGAPRTIDYERYLRDDANGGILVQSAMQDLMNGARAQHNDWLATQTSSPIPDTSFQLHSGAIGVGSDGRYPYPATENWQKAIGAHIIWITADVTVTIDNEAQTRDFDIDMTINMEDRYNFNPGAADLASGTPDADNGRFEITGLGHEYTNSGSAFRNFTFGEALSTPPDAPPVDPTMGTPSRAPHPEPADARAHPGTR